MFSTRVRILFCVICALGLVVVSIRHAAHSSDSELYALASSSSLATWRELQSFLVEGGSVSNSILQQEQASLLTPRDARLLKYHRTYQYILPADRYDYNPYPAKECGGGPDFDPFFKLGFLLRSRASEDYKIYNFLFKEHLANITTTDSNGVTSPGGTYVELGAYDGSQESNTHFFDKCLGWKGLLIEGNPDSYKKVIANRPFAHKMSLAPSCSAEYEAVNKTIPFYRYPLTNVGLVGSAVTFTGKPTVPVPCGPLGPILEDVFAENGRTIHFFSLDVEGAERMVLDTVDFSKIFVHVLMIEIKNNACQAKCKVRADVRAYMANAGYLRYEGVVHASDIYVHPESPYQMPASIKPQTG